MVGTTSTWTYDHHSRTEPRKQKKILTFTYVITDSYINIAIHRCVDIDRDGAGEDVRAGERCGRG